MRHRCCMKRFARVEAPDAAWRWYSRSSPWLRPLWPHIIRPKHVRSPSHAKNISTGIPAGSTRLLDVGPASPSQLWGSILGRTTGAWAENTPLSHASCNVEFATVFGWSSNFHTQSCNLSLEGSKPTVVISHDHPTLTKLIIYWTNHCEWIGSFVSEPWRCGGKKVHESCDDIWTKATSIFHVWSDVWWDLRAQCAGRITRYSP